MAVKDSEKTRKPTYWLAILAGAAVAVLIGVETVHEGFTAGLADAVETVVTRLDALVVSVSSALAGWIALRNFTGSDNTEQGI